jgi:diacylglycerol kinase
MSKFFRGFLFAYNGLLHTFRTQINFKVQVFSALAVIGLSFYLGMETNEWLWIILAITLVLTSELANTAIETLVDLVSPEINPKAGIIKDIFAGLVLISALFAAIVALLILLPKIIYAS